MPTMTMMGKQGQGLVWAGGVVFATAALVLASPVVRAQHADAPKSEATSPAATDAHAAPAAGHDAAAAQDTHAPTGDHGAAASHGAEGDHGESPLVTLARFANFAILVGAIYWLARKPLANHLASRGAQIRKDLVDAAQTRADAAERLALIEAKLAALPSELEQLRVRGVAELEAERARIRAVAEAERDRLVAQARREIAAQTRHAREQLRADAASLTVDVAADRLRATLTPAEQAALVDDYAVRMRNVQ